MLWKFEKAGDGWYYLENIGRPGAKLAADDTTRGYCWKPSEVHLCKEDGWGTDGDAQGCEWKDCQNCQHGYRYAFPSNYCCHYKDLHDHDDCYCKDTTVKNVGGPDGKGDDRFKFRFEDIYASKSFWKTIYEYTNKGGCAGKKTITVTQGYTESYSKSTSKTMSLEYGLSTSAEMGIEVASFEKETSLQLKAETTTAVSQASQGHYEIEEKTDQTIPPHRCYRYTQIQVEQKDHWSNDLKMSYTSTIQDFGPCEDPPRFWGPEDTTTCPPDQVIDLNKEAETAVAGAKPTYYPPGKPSPRSAKGSTFMRGITPQARENVPGEYDDKFAPPKENLVVSIINKKYQWTRIQGGASWIDYSDQNKKELWTFEEQLTPGQYLILNADSGEKLECGGDYRVRTKSGSINDNMLWKFEKAGDGWYYLENIGRPGAKLAADDTTRGYCWKPSEVHLCREDGWG